LLLRLMAAWLMPAVAACKVANRECSVEAAATLPELPVTVAVAAAGCSRCVSAAAAAARVGPPAVAPGTPRNAEVLENKRATCA